MLESPTTAARFIGAPGTLAGVSPALEPDETLVPMALVAVTVNVYVTPFVNPVITAFVVELVTVMPPGLELTV